MRVSLKVTGLDGWLVLCVNLPAPRGAQIFGYALLLGIFTRVFGMGLAFELVD
jgi:hypothetical protein